MFYRLVVITATVLCYGFGNYIIKNRWLKGIVLCLGWILTFFTQAEVQRMATVYPTSSIRNYFLIVFVEVVCLIFLFRRFSR